MTTSVVVPTRNRRAVLLPVLATILGQRGIDLEVIVVDEGSDDGTSDAVGALGDDRVRLVRHDDAKGLPAARNAGLAVATGATVAFCDDDDLWAPTKLQRQLEAMSAARAVWSCTGAVEVDSQLKVVGWEPLPGGGIDRQGLLRRNLVPGGGSSVVVRTEVVVDLGGFDDTLRSAEDWDLWIRLAGITDPALVDLPLVGYRIWPASMSRDVSRMDAAVGAVRARYGAPIGETAESDREHARYRIKQLVRNRQRLDAAAALVKLGRHPVQGRPSDLAKAPLAALAPAWYLRTATARSHNAVPATWHSVAEEWLSPLRDLVRAAVAA